MKISELVNILGVNKLAPIHLMENYNEWKFAECKHLTDKERDDFQQGYWIEGKEYDTSALGVYLANTDIEKYYEFENKYNPWQLKDVLDDISYLFILNIKDRPIVCVTYAILHEVGHWINFKKSGMTSIEYGKWDSNFRREPSECSKFVREMPYNHPMKLVYAKEAVKKYRNIPSEKLADEYAFENLIINLNKLNVEIRKIEGNYIKTI